MCGSSCPANPNFFKIARALSKAKDECVLATLVNLDGSGLSPRRGARMLIQANRAVSGGISAGCLEEEIRQCAFDWTRAGAMTLFSDRNPYAFGVVSYGCRLHPHLSFYGRDS